MAEKSDEEIIKEVGLETSTDISTQEALDKLSLEKEKNLETSDLDIKLEEITDSDKVDNEKNNKILENEDRDDFDETMTSENNNEKIPIQKKQSKIYKILIGAALLLILILTMGVILYFTGFFDPEPVKIVDKKTVIKKIEPEINFNSKDLDKTRLNKKLSLLTKHEIMNKEELEAEEKRIKAEEKKKKDAEEKAILEKKREEEAKLEAQFKKIENEKKLLQEHQEEIKAQQENFLKLQEQAKLELEQAKMKLLDEVKSQNNTIEEEIPLKNNEEMLEEIPQDDKKDIAQSFLSFINVATIKGSLYKSFLDEIQKYDKNISLCRDYKNRIEVYFGPYDSNKERKKIFDNLLDNGFKEAYLIDFTNEEYEKRCKY